MYAANPTPVATGASCFSSQAIHKVLIGSNSPVGQHQPRRKMYVSIPPNPHPTRLNIKSSDTIQPQAERNNKRKASSLQPTSNKKQKANSQGRQAVLAPITQRRPGNIIMAVTTFSFLGTRSCGCKNVPDSAAHVKHCSVLEYFGFYYSRELGLLICYDHRCAVLLDHWVEHIQKHHQFISSKELVGMKDHIAKSFGAAASISELNIPDALTDVLPMKDLHAGEHPPMLARFKCPVTPSCRVWCASNNPRPNISITHELSHHIRTHNTSIKKMIYRSRS